MEPMETDRQNEAPRRRETASSRGGTAGRGEAPAGDGRGGDGSTSAYDGAATSRAGDGMQDHEEEIRRRAYEIYEARGGAPGSDVDDWCAAEREIRGSRGQRAD
jgi:hypothetical protein